ncbi:hypothetical protein RRG08_001508 [Elysia crispata]|uniref:Uncharacterized protein n=1 Tax=Elysia crispata TaxID=231223 RepID=A0AAE1DVT3_9GAST|nr:hypothetical protein RRG08_001508 [Elysia crispata]
MPQKNCSTNSTKHNHWVCSLRTFDDLNDSVISDQQSTLSERFHQQIFVTYLLNIFVGFIRRCRDIYLTKDTSFCWRSPAALFM